MNIGQTGACGKTWPLGLCLHSECGESPPAGPQHLAEPILCFAFTDAMWRDAENHTGVALLDVSVGRDLLPPSPQRMDPHICSQERNVSPSFPAMQRPAAPRKCLRGAQLAGSGPCFVPGPCKHVSYSSLAAWEPGGRYHSPMQLGHQAWVRGCSRAHWPAIIPCHASPDPGRAGLCCGS